MRGIERDESRSRRNDISRLGSRLARSGALEACLIATVGAGAVLASLALAPGWSGAAGAALAVLMLAVAAIDHRHMIIPDELNALAFAAGLAAAWLTAEGPPAAAIADALLRSGLMFVLFFAFRLAYRRLRGRAGLGLGDVKLAAVAGVWLDWFDLPLAVNIAALSALGAVLYGRLRGKAFDPKARLPFGAFFAPAIWICWLLAAWRSH